MPSRSSTDGKEEALWSWPLVDRISTGNEVMNTLHTASEADETLPKVWHYVGAWSWSASPEALHDPVLQEGEGPGLDVVEPTVLPDLMDPAHRQASCQPGRSESSRAIAGRTVRSCHLRTRKLPRRIVHTSTSRLATR